MNTQQARDEFYQLIDDDEIFASQYANNEFGFYNWLADFHSDDIEE